MPRPPKKTAKYHDAIQLIAEEGDAIGTDKMKIAEMISVRMIEMFSGVHPIDIADDILAKRQDDRCYAAYNEGRAARFRGLTRREVPGKFRGAAVKSLATAWDRGWDAEDRDTKSNAEIGAAANAALNQT